MAAGSTAHRARPCAAAERTVANFMVPATKFHKLSDRARGL
jgi:hypothetical protein